MPMRGITGRHGTREISELTIQFIQQIYLPFNLFLIKYWLCSQYTLLPKPSSVPLTFTCWQENQNHNISLCHPYISKSVADQDMHSLLAKTCSPNSTDLVYFTCTKVMQTHKIAWFYIFLWKSFNQAHFTYFSLNLIHFSMSNNSFIFQSILKYILLIFYVKIDSSKQVSQSFRVPLWLSSPGMQ